MSYRYSSTPTDLNAKRATHLTAARALVDQAKAASRELAPSEQETVESYLAEIETLDRQIKGRHLVTSITSLGNAENDHYAEHGIKGSIFTADDAAGLVHAVRTRSSFRTEVPSKAVIGAVGLLPTSGTGIVPGLHPNNVFPLASLFANESVDGPSVRYYTMDSATAAVVAEGALKPDAGLVVTGKDAAVIKIATTALVSDELSDDAPQMVRAIGNELQAAVVTAENAHVISSLNTSGILTNTETAATLIDVIAEEVGVQTATTGFVPSAVLVGPTVLADLQQQRAIANGNYLFDPLSSSPASVHGVPLIATEATPAATAWVVGGRAATMYRRNGITVEVGLSADDFLRNQTHLRAEERVVCAVQRPGMISKITIS